MLFPQSTHCIVSKEDYVSFPNKTMCGFHTGQCVVATQDNLSFPNRTMCGVHTGQCVVSRQDNVLLLKRTGHFDVVETNALKPPCRNVHTETSTPKRPRRNVHAETSTPKRPRRNVRAETRTTNNFSAGIFSVGHMKSYQERIMSETWI